MTRDEQMVRQLQQRLSNWKPSESCLYHSWMQSCVYDDQGELLELHLCQLELQQIPQEVWQFSSLQGLYLSGTQVSGLPKEVWNLTSLQRLDLSRTWISSLSKEVGNLTSLQGLYLSETQVSSLPKEVGNLTSLQGLYLSRTWISSLPREVWNLTSLQELYLSGTRVSSLPREVGNLTALRVLDLRETQLSNLPREVGNLTSLQRLHLSKNSLDEALLQVMPRGVPAILAYLRTLPGELDTYLASQQIQSTTSKQPVHQPMPPINIFYSYARKDEALREDLEAHLSTLRSQGIIADWHDQHIPAGTEPQQIATAYLEQADLILLLVSANFIASEQCTVEVQQAMQRHDRGEARVVPILLRSCDWHGTLFDTLPFLPDATKPLTLWLDRDEAFFQVVQGIRRNLHVILSARSNEAQQKLQSARSQIDTLRDPYTNLKDALDDASSEESDLAEQTLAIDAQIAALQQQRQTIQQQRTALAQKQDYYKQQRQELEQQALVIRAHEVEYEQEEQQLNEQLKKVQVT